MINDVFVTTTLQDLMDKLSLQTETVLEIWYSFALDKPKKTLSIPQDEWISAIRALRNVRGSSASSYAVAFFNGDLKIYDGKADEKKEAVVVQHMHENRIDDVLYLVSESMEGNKYLVTCSQQPDPALKVCRVGSDDKSVTLMSQASSEFGEALGGWNNLSLNPADHDVFAASSVNFVKKPQGDVAEGQRELGSIQVWKLSDETLTNQAVRVGSLKRQKTEVSTFEPAHTFHVSGGVESLTWLNGETLVAGCQDHAIKLIDAEKSYIVKQSILTQHKVPTCIDTAQDNLVLMGSEDAILRLWDIRDKSGKQVLNEYKSHSAYIT